MYRVLVIGDKSVPMEAVGSVDFIYQSIFGIDPIKEQLSGDEATLFSFCARMGFVMAKTAEIKSQKERKQLTEDDFLDWLDQFERSDYINALPEIRLIYESQKEPSSKEKKRVEE